MIKFRKALKEAAENAKIVLTQELIDKLGVPTTTAGNPFKPGDKLLTCMVYSLQTSTITLVRYTQDEIPYYLKNYEYFTPLMDSDFIPNETVPFIIVKKKYTPTPPDIADAIKNGIEVTEEEALGDDWKNLPFGEGESK